MAAYDPSEWSDLFVAVAGASAALAGLVFVAVSINVERILKYPGLPERALETVLTLLIAVLVSIVGLIPGQSQGALGAELLGLSLVFGGAVASFPVRRSDTKEPPSWIVWRWAMRLVVVMPLTIGGVGVLFGVAGGLYWVVAGIIFAITVSVINAWVLLVEILR